MSPLHLVPRCDSLGLTQLLATFHRDGVSYRALRAARDDLDDDLRVAVDLLCLNETVDADRARDVLGVAFDELVARGAARPSGGTVTLGDVRLVDHHGRLVFVGRPGGHDGGYYGPDSVGLGRLLSRAAGRCLDLFASTGAQSLLMAHAAGHVTAVELRRELSEVFDLNVAMHDLADRVTPVWGDALTVDLGDEPFDTVAVNAPLFPSFGVTGLDEGADGGFAGHTLLAKTLPRVRLTPEGRIHSTATTLGSPKGPDLDWLERAAAETGLSFDVIPTGTGRLTDESAFGRQVVATLADASGDEQTGDRLTALWRETGVDRVYFCLVTGFPAPRPAVRLLSRYEGGKGWWM